MNSAYKFLSAILFAATLAGPVVQHEWNIEFEKLNRRDQKAYWAWRHKH